MNQEPGDGLSRSEGQTYSESVIGPGDPGRTESESDYMVFSNEEGWCHISISENNPR